MATIKDIADRLGIASSTVSKGLNGASDISDDLRQLVLDTAIEMGYTSKKMRHSDTKKLCIIVENMAYENQNDFGYDIVLGFRQMALRENWDVVVSTINSSLQTKERYDTYMLRNGFSGAFLVGFSLHDDWIMQLSNTNVPTVLFDNYIPKNTHVGCVGTDNYEGIDLAIEYLVSLGHKNIAFLNGEKDSMVSTQRYHAFIESMENKNLNANPKLITFGYYDADCAKYYVKDFIENGATAIVCASDLIANGVIKECTKNGVTIPEDMSVIGFDDLPTSTNLTTIRQDRIELGKSAYVTLSGLLSEVAISRTTLRPQLIIRNTTDICK